MSNDVLRGKRAKLAESALRELEKRTGQKLSDLPPAELKKRIKELEKAEKRRKKVVE